MDKPRFSTRSRPWYSKGLIITSWQAALTWLLDGNYVWVAYREGDAGGNTGKSYHPQFALHWPTANLLQLIFAGRLYRAIKHER